ncbi:MAG: hypothetical protein GC191_00830 [Azospirillum sp.]|nr:hypothetical protein [Azospirillum sp.]
MIGGIKAGLLIGPVLALLLATGCGSDADRAAYIYPTPFSGYPAPSTFLVRYSERRNSPAEVRNLIAETCGPKFDTARIFPDPYYGTLMHPSQARVVCGAEPPPETTLRFVVPDAGELIVLRDTARRLAAPARP